MASLADAFRPIVGDEKADKVKKQISDQANQKSVEQNRKEASRIGESIEHLRGKTNVKSFRATAKSILLHSPTKKTAEEVIIVAHELFKGSTENRLHYFLAGIRDNIQHIPNNMKEQFICRALRSSNPTLEK